MGKADCRAFFSMPEGMAREAGPGAPSAAQASRRLGGVFETPPPGARREGRKAKRGAQAGGRFGAGARMLEAQRRPKPTFQTA